MTRTEAENWRERRKVNMDSWVIDGNRRVGATLRTQDGRSLHVAADSLESAAEIVEGALAARALSNECRRCGGRAESRFCVDGELLALCLRCNGALLHQLVDRLSEGERAEWWATLIQS